VLEAAVTDQKIQQVIKQQVLPTQVAVAADAILPEQVAQAAQAW
jgi:hypothetical protein